MLIVSSSSNHGSPFQWPSHSRAAIRTLKQSLAFTFILSWVRLNVIGWYLAVKLWQACVNSCPCSATQNTANLWYQLHKAEPVSSLIQPAVNGWKALVWKPSLLFTAALLEVNQICSYWNSEKGESNKAVIEGNLLSLPLSSLQEHCCVPDEPEARDSSFVWGTEWQLTVNG